MFCRFCGKSIEGDSMFCPYCGKSIEESTTGAERTISQLVMPNTTSNLREDAYYLSQISKIAGSTLRSITKIICYIALDVFLFLNIKMAPSYGMTKTVIRTAQIFHLLLAVISNRQNRRKALKSLGLLRNQNHPKLSSFIRCYP